MKFLLGLETAYIVMSLFLDSSIMRGFFLLFMPMAVFGMIMERGALK